MATATAPSTTLSHALLKRIHRRNRPRLSQAHADELREHELDTIPRNGSCPVTTVEEFLERLDSATLCVSGLRERYDNEGRSDWWHMADLLDDLADLRVAVRGNDRHGQQGNALCKLVYLVDPPLPELPSQAQLIAAAQAISSMRRVRRPGAVVYTPDEMALRETMHAELRLEKLQNLQLCAGPDIKNAAMFKERLASAVRSVADLRERYEVDGRSDWWHMADLLDDLADLLDTVRSSPRNRTNAIFAVVDLPYT